MAQQHAATAAAFVQIHSLCVDRGDRRVLDNVSLTLRTGQCVAVVGPNGAGKTTLMQAALGLLPTSAGQILIDATPVTSLDRRDIAQRIAYLPQQYEGFLGFRVRQVVESGRYAHSSAFDGWSEDDRDAIDQAVRQCGLESFLDRRLEALSGGERQKVWLAAALTQASPALFLDEPTSALDPHHQVDLIRLIRAQRDAGKAIMLICHDLNLPAMLDCHVLALRDGRTVFDGPVEAFMDTQLLRDVFDTDFDLVPDHATGRQRIHLRV